jgi:hypothetical protein
MSLEDDLLYYTTLFLQGIAGQNPAGTIEEHRYGKLRQTQFALEQERLRQNMEEERHRAILEEKKLQNEIIKQQEEADFRAAQRYAKTGLRDSDVLEAITQFSAAQSPEEAQASKIAGRFPALETLAPGADRSRPGVYITTPAQSSMEAYALVQQQLEEENLAREIEQQRADREAEAARLAQGQANINLRERELGLSRERHLQDVKTDKVQEGLVEAQTNMLIQKMKDAGKAGSISPAQAAGIAFGMFGDSVDPDNSESLYKVTEFAHQIRDAWNNPDKARARLGLMDSIRRFEERRMSGAFDDEKIGQGAPGGLPGAIQQKNEETGEQGMQRLAPEPPVPPQMPAIQGRPDARAMDPNVSFIDLIGGNKEIQRAIEEKEMNEDNYRLEWQARHLMSLGVPENEMPPDVQQYIRARRDPEKELQGLIQQ